MKVTRILSFAEENHEHIFCSNCIRVMDMDMPMLLPMLLPMFMPVFMIVRRILVDVFNKKESDKLLLKYSYIYVLCLIYIDTHAANAFIGT